MKKIFKFVSILLILSIAGPCLAIDVSSLGLNIPNIQSVGNANQTTSAGDMVLESPIDAKSYKVGPGDILAIHIIVGDSELSIDQNLLVGADGNIFFPNIGAIYLSGMTLDQAKIKLDSKIAGIYNETYKLYVMLSQPKKVKIYLSGMVKMPGPISVYDNSRISEVLALSGGVASGASNRYVYIIRKALSGSEEVLKADIFEAYRSRDLSKDIRIQAGDIVEVPDANNQRISQSTSEDNDKLLFEGKETFVYVYGEVTKSGRFEYVPGKRLSDYISYAGGPTAKALLSQTKITRQGEKQVWVDASNVIYNGNTKNDVEIFGGDVISVPGNFFYVSDFSSFANTILLGLTLYNSVKR